MFTPMRIGETMDASRSLMEPSYLVGMWCALMTTIQTLAAIYGYVEAHRKKRLEAEGSPMVSRFNPLPVSIALTVGALGTIALTVWLFVANPMRPKTDTVYVNKPCQPAQQTGNATASNGSSAQTGNGNGASVNPASPSARPEKPKPK
jgi:hypothetical protein